MDAFDKVLKDKDDKADGDPKKGAKPKPAAAQHRSRRNAEA